MSRRQVIPARKEHTFTLDSREAKCVAVTGSFCGWDPVAHPLKRTHHGLWRAKLMLPPGQYEYRFLVDGQWQDDPVCGERVPNPFGSENCVVRV